MTFPTQKNRFRIKFVSMGDNQYLVQVLESLSGSKTSTFSFPTFAIAFEYESLNSEKQREWGEILFEHLMSVEIRDSYMQSFPKNGEKLSILLDFSEAIELSAIPWELLYDTTHSRFLAQSIDTPITRTVALENTNFRATSVASDVLSILMVSCNLSSSGAYLDTEAESQNLREIFGESNKHSLIFLENPTFEVFQKTLAEQPIDILYFAGHGEISRDNGRCTLLFSGKDGYTYPIAAESFAQATYNQQKMFPKQPIQLVYLSACQTASTSASRFFSGVAQKLQEQGIPSVIGMQGNIADEDAVAASQRFFQSLAAGRSLEEAIVDTRLLFSYNGTGAQWLLPVLYTDHPQIRLVKLQPKSALRNVPWSLDDTKPFNEELFSFVNAEDIPINVLEGTFVEPPDWLDHIADLKESSIVIAGPGYGKTSIRKKLKQYAYEDTRDFVQAYMRNNKIEMRMSKKPTFFLEYDQFDFPELVAQPITVKSSHHIRPFLRSIARSLYEFIISYPQYFLGYRSSIRQWSWAFISTYIDGNTLDTRLRGDDNALKVDADKLGPFRNPIQQEATLVGVCTSVKDELSKLQFSNVIVLVDGIKSALDMTTDISEFDIVRPLLGVPKVSRFFVWKVFLDLAEKAELNSVSNFRLSTIRWNEDLLQELLSLHLERASKTDESSLDQVIDKNLREQMNRHSTTVEKELVRMALQSKQTGPPRALMMYGRLLLKTWEKSGNEFIDPAIWADFLQKISK